MTLRRLLALSGILSVLLAIAGAIFASQGNSPDLSASGSTVLAFYVTNASTQMLGVILLTLAFAFFVAFSAFLRGWLRPTPVSEALSTLALAGAAVELVGQTLGGGITYALILSHSSMSADAAQALNVLAGGLVLVPAIGLFTFGLAIGLAILSTKLLPKWLGWAAIGIGITVLTPVEGFSFLALALWMLTVSFLAWRRLGTQPATC